MYPEALLCYTGPSYEGLHYWLISRGAVTPRGRTTRGGLSIHLTAFSVYTITYPDRTYRTFRTFFIFFLKIF